MSSVLELCFSSFVIDYIVDFFGTFISLCIIEGFYNLSPKLRPDGRYSVDSCGEIICYP
jgi:hypothetical protein